MNLPNRLTLLRLILTPVCLALLALGQTVWCAALFAVACLTDTLDGYLARSRGMITTLGKFADPIADKALTLTMMILLAALGRLPVWLPLIVCVRELAVDGLRLIAAERGVVIPAGKAGKIKTILQMALILCALLLPPGAWASWGAAAVAAVTVYSGWGYLRGSRELLMDDTKTE